ncbi:M20/M25/M40 family metallo-hydrolase [Vallitalea guaymasensis]|uniref:M20/M25/M40 family metallo-hydrolase n=1 Tax=Vallitalea guaymasensis TaxID=1185412 RepID=A0A8J8SDG7_9FIRM|nr:M20/M25/M40 family metallo-hydrolase [Vallitalea guaymasensis]QUH30475.1 M20/M25/M40 family metallo-hydrolase [Vallitalea guaymasensis]
MYLYLVLAIIILLLIIITVRTIRFKNVDIHVSEQDSNVKYDRMACANKLAKSVQIKTISNSDYSITDWEQFKRYHSLIEEMFPLVHKNIDRKIINEYSLLYHWNGKNKNNKKPIIITAHMDVVPIEEGTEKDWKQEPFSGAIVDDIIWGRGTIDTKVHMIAVLEAAELLLKEGFVPDRDVYFGFGHDEEVGGKQGAVKIVEYLKGQGIEFDYVLDEGGCVTEGAIKEIAKPIALIGIGEKGYCNIKIEIEGNGGHASMPPKHTSLGLIGQVINNLETKQCKLKLTKPVEEFLLKIGPEMKLLNRIILSNLWLFRPLFVRVFSKMQSGNALLRTTTAVTMAEGSMEPNVLPQKASVTCNFRVLPGETGEDLVNHIEQVNKDIPIKIQPLRMEDPSMISSSKTEGFKKIENITNRVYKDVIVAPYIVLAGTDARKYEPVCNNIYRFSPYKLHNDELGKIHGTNENLSVDNVNKCLEFFYYLLKES